jgi:hypothetical protein
LHRWTTVDQGQTVHPGHDTQERKGTETRDLPEREVSVEIAHLPAGSVGDTDDVKSDTSSRGASVHGRSSTAKVLVIVYITCEFCEFDLLEVFSGSPVVSRRLDNDPVVQLRSFTAPVAQITYLSPMKSRPSNSRIASSASTGLSNSTKPKLPRREISRSL